MVKSDIKLYRNILIASLVVHAVLLVITRFTAWPEMLAWPYLLNEGWLPYQDIAIAHTPLLIVILSFVYKIFDVGIFQLQLFAWVIILATTALVWFITKKLWGETTALIAVILYPFYQVFFEGNGLWFDLVLAPLFLIMFYLIQQKKYIHSGLILGISLFMKQTAVWMFIPVAIQLFSNGSRKIMELEKRYVPFLYGTVLVIFAGTLLMYLSGVLPYFAHWAIEFGALTLPRLPGQLDLPSLTEFMKAAITFLPLVMLAVLSREKKNIELLLWFGFAGMGAYPRWELFHFQPAIPFLVIGTALSIKYIFASKKLYLHAAALVLTALVFAVLFIKFMYSNVGQPVRFFERSVQEVIETVKVISNEADEIYVINYWDSVYALSDREPAVRPFIPYIPWYLDYQNFDQHIALEIRSSLPEVIIRGDYDDGLSSYEIEGVENIISRFYSQYYSENGVNIYLKN